MDVALTLGCASGAGADGIASGSFISTSVMAAISIVLTPTEHSLQYTPFNFLLRPRPCSMSFSVMRLPHVSQK